MKISEVIVKLEQLKAKHGDLPCVAQDGLDPSDPAFIIDIELEHEYQGVMVGQPPYAFFRT